MSSKAKKIIVATTVVFGLCFYTFYHNNRPRPISHSCKQFDLCRYRFKIYICPHDDDYSFNNKKGRKIGGLLEYLGLKKIKCPSNLDQETILALKARIDGANRKLQWRELQNGLWENDRREVGFAVTLFLGEDISTIDYITTVFTRDGQKPLREIIDIPSFQVLNNHYLKDKNHIYRRFTMYGGDTLSILEEADPKTFTILNEYYAKDKNHCYFYRSGIIKNAHSPSFQILKDGTFAQDKYRHYQWGEPLTSTELR